MKRNNTWIPSALENLITTNNLTDKQVEAIVYLFKLLCRKHYQSDNWTSFIPLQASLLFNKMGLERKFATDFLVDNKVIDFDPHYITGIQSMKYRISYSFVESSHINITNKKFTRDKESCAEKIMINLEYTHTNKMTKLAISKLSIMDSAETMCDLHYGETSLVGLTVKNMIEDIRSNRLRSSVNTTNFRLDSNITNLPSFVWRGTTLDKQQIIESDMSSMGPLIIGHLLKDNTSFFFPSYYDTAKKETVDSSEVEEWSKRSANGTFYTNLCLVYGHNNIDVIKKDVQTFLYGEAGVKSTLRFAYPTICNLIDSYKRKHSYELFSVSIHKIESSIFIKRILKELHDDNILCLSKHDCILYKKCDMEIVQEVMHRHLSDYFGDGNYNLKHTNLTQGIKI